MSKTVLIILSTVLVLGLTLLVTNILSRRKKTDLADWEVGGRDLPYYVVIGTQFATAMGGGVLVGHVGNAYNFGLSILFYGVFSSSTLLFIALIAKWLRRNNFVTVPDVVQSFRGRNKAISIFAGVMSAVIPFGWCISNLSAFAKLYTRMTGIPMNVLITCLAIACIAFVLPAGLKTVAWTDFIFGIVIVIGGVFVTMKSLDMAGGFSNVVEVLPPEIMSFPKGLFAVGGFTLLSWFLSLVPGGITNQMYFQRVFAIRDEKRIVPTLLISVVLVFLTDVWAFFMGTSIRAQNPDLAGEMATGWLLDQLPIWFIVIFAGMITCTILSTISSGIQSTVVNITRDCYGALNPEAAKDGAKMMRVSRTLTVILIAFAAISAMFIPSVLNTLVYTYSYSAASMLMPVYGAYIFRKKDFCTNQGILASMVGGTVVCIICQIIGTPIPFVAYGLVASIICFFVVGYLTRTPVKADYFPQETASDESSIFSSLSWQGERQPGTASPPALLNCQILQHSTPEKERTTYERTLGHHRRRKRRAGICRLPLNGRSRYHSL